MNLKNIYDSRRVWKFALITASLVLMAAFLLISNDLVKDLAEQERDRMEIWANATKELASINTVEPTADSLGNVPPMATTDVDFLLEIIEGNHNIPVLLVDDDGNILLNRNFQLPEPIDSLSPYEISTTNMQFLQKKLKKLEKSQNRIDINIDASTTQHLYYEDSTVLRRLAYYPYIQLAVLIIFIGIAYFALISVKKAEQNKVWVGLSKETAHQLGTPISSLMAWTQLLESMGIDHDIVANMDKDVHRLSTIAERFSKIGSKPEMQLEFINEAVNISLDYMRDRIPKRVEMTINTTPEANCGLMLCPPLFAWVMENLTKNAVDAMGGEGKLTIDVTSTSTQAIILVTDTGKGIARKNFKNVFTPGFTTKKRGWGLGLTLVKRIVEDYHGGRIYVKDSEIGRGTTFAIELPRIPS